MGFFFFPPLISCFQFHGFLLSSVLFFFFFFGVYLLFFFYFFVVETSVSDFRSVFFSNICIQCYKFPIKHCSHRIPYIWVCCILNFPLIKNIFEFWRFLLWPMWYLEMCFFNREWIFFTYSAKATQQRNGHLFNKWCWKNGHPYEKNTNKPWPKFRIL